MTLRKVDERVTTYTRFIFLAVCIVEVNNAGSVYDIVGLGESTKSIASIDEDQRDLARMWHHFSDLPVIFLIEDVYSGGVKLALILAVPFAIRLEAPDLGSGLLDEQLRRVPRTELHHSLRL
jgi:hypothetical protein